MRNPRRRRRSFTLLEMLVTVGLLSILMLMLFRFFANMQNAYNHTLKGVVLADESRIAFGLIAKDLQGAIARENDMPGLDIRFHQPSSSQLWFVSASEGSPEAKSSLLEIGYRLENNQLQRAFVDDSNSAWNVYGDRDAAADQYGYQTVLGNVLALKFTCYTSNLTPYPPNNAVSMPALVGVEMTLIDSKSRVLLETLPEAKREEIRRKYARTFRRVISLQPSG
ncbi:MAG: prepilin-type N-terminal cleavage/methylation domain-containing protein [Lentisphaeria bacterium]|nr:prepilin-type N-terminal cleavage/methylation domain-containing protein [Lentisphaeria bacterium]